MTEEGAKNRDSILTTLYNERSFDNVYMTKPEIKQRTNIDFESLSVYIDILMQEGYISIYSENNMRFAGHPEPLPKYKIIAKGIIFLIEDGGYEQRRTTYMEASALEAKNIQYQRDIQETLAKYQRWIVLLTFCTLLASLTAMGYYAMQIWIFFHPIPPFCHRL